MAVNPRDIGVTRDELQAWLDEYKSNKNPKGTLKQHLTTKLADKGLVNTVVNTEGHESLPDNVPLVDLIMSDLASYE